MARYSYQAKAANGQMSRGEIDAVTEAEVRVRLRSRGLEAVSISRATGKNVKSTVSFFDAKVNSRDLQVFTRQFATLINAGIPVVDSLKILSDGLRPGLLKDAVLHVKVQIESGRRMAESMAQRPQVFDKLYCNMIQAGEEAGILDTILQRLSIYLEKSEKIKRQVKGALVYPGVIVTVSLLVVTGILVFIIPKFQDFYSGTGRELPALTKIVVGVSNFIIANWFYVLGLLIAAPIVFVQWIRTPSGGDAFDRFVMQTPVFGEVVRKSSVARLSRTLSTLLSSGVSVLEAIDIAARTSGNVVIEQSLMRTKEAVSAGKPFAQPLAKEKVFPDMVVQMIGVGEQSGTMDQMLSKIADFYEDEVENAVKAMTSIIEPIMMVGLGGIIAVIMVAMYMPIFGMADGVQ